MGMTSPRNSPNTGEKTFAAKPIDLEKARVFARNLAVDFELGAVPHRKIKVLEFYRKLRHSAPRPNGLPYGAWKATGKIGARAMTRDIEELMEGKPAPANFNKTLGVFPAMGRPTTTPS